MYDCGKRCIALFMHANMLPNCISTMHVHEIFRFIFTPSISLGKSFLEQVPYIFKAKEKDCC